MTHAELLSELERLEVLFNPPISMSWLHDAVRHYHRNVEWPEPTDGSPLDRYDGSDAAALINMLPQLKSALRAAQEAMQDFVDKCDRGEARSVRSYAKFKAVLTAERFEEIKADRFMTRSAYDELIASHDALTARIAELEREYDILRSAGEQALTEITRLEAELAAARKPPEDGEVRAMIEELLEPRATLTDKRAADLLTRQAAALAEAERERKRWEYLAEEAWKRANDAHSESLKDNLARQKLKSALATARRDALEDAAKFIDDKMGRPFGDDLRRALQQKDTAP